MSRTSLTVATMALLAFLASGCQQASTSQSPPGGGAEALKGDPPAAEPETSDEIPLKILSWEEIQQLIASKKGKVVVVDVWSTWCEPCKREFPNLVELQKKYGDRIACISISVDYIGLPNQPPESYREAVLDFLKKVDARLENVLSKATDEQVFRHLEISSIPAVLVYNQDGALVKKFVNDSGEFGDEGFTYKDHIIPLVEKLLSAS